MKVKPLSLLNLMSLMSKWGKRFRIRFDHLTFTTMN